MTKRAAAQRRAAQERIQCHFVSNTHWDREWKHSAQRTRHMLVYLMDMLLDILEREPRYKSFHLDSQTLPLLDYLDIRPAQEERLRRHVTQGRLIVGPWFCLPDEFCVSGESLIRNLLLGHRIARRYGAVAKTGYSPFSWGQISQMPQLYRGFGIDVMMFYRGVNTLVAPRAEFIWRGPDGSELIASRLGARPRYNAWYVLQRPAYWGVPLDALNDFERPWSHGGAPFRLADAAHAEFEYQLAHPPHRYDARVMPRAARQALREQDADWSTPHRLWSAGHDLSCPDVREVRLIADSARALRRTADVYHSTLAAFQDGLRQHRRADWPVVTGEMRHTYTRGSTSALLGWIISARTYLKQDNCHTERLLFALAEPLAAFAALLGAPYPREFLDRAGRWLLENHSHDSIGGCGRDVVHDDMLYRSRQAREIGECVLEQALREIAGAIDLRDWPATDVALVAYNPLPAVREAVVPLVLDLPAEWKSTDFELVDERGRPVAVQRCGPPAPFAERLHNPHDVFTFLNVQRQELRALLPALPGLGYRTFRVRPAQRRRPARHASLRTGPQSMANDLLAVTINANGTLDIADKRTRRHYANLGYFRDSGAAGNPWQHEAPAEDTLLTTRDVRAVVTLVHDGPLETTFRVDLPWELPARLTPDGRARSATRVPYPIVNRVTLRRGEPWVEIVTELENVAEDHYLRVSFPTGLRTDTVQVQSPFDVVTRPTALPDAAQFDEPPQPEQPMDAFIDVSDGRAGLALLNDGLKAYEAHADAESTLSLTLLRCFALRFFVPNRTDYPDQARGAQCPGRHTFRYAVSPHAGDWARGGVWAAAERFNVPVLAAQIGPTQHGSQPRSRAFLEVEPEGLHVSAVKQSESGAGWIVRVFNPRPTAVRATLRLNDGWSGPPASRSPMERVRTEFALPAERGQRWRRVRQVTLEEMPERDLTLDARGWVRVRVPGKRIVTVEFLG